VKCSDRRNNKSSCNKQVASNCKGQ